LKLFPFFLLCLQKNQSDFFPSVCWTLWFSFFSSHYEYKDNYSNQIREEKKRVPSMIFRWMCIYFYYNSRKTMKKSNKTDDVLINILFLDKRSSNIRVDLLAEIDTKQTVKIIESSTRLFLFLIQFNVNLFAICIQSFRWSYND